MKLLLKLVILAVAIAALLPVIRPGAPVSEVVSAAIEDVGGFCERNQSACDQGQQIAVRAGDLLTHALRSLTEEETEPAQPLTAEDRALSPNEMVQNPAAPAQQPAFATNNAPPQP